jgi:ubiquinone/menaquinone biosynthesis C-methylase UbiE
MTMKTHAGTAAILALIAVFSLLSGCSNTKIKSATHDNAPCRVLANNKVEEPLTTITREYERRSGNTISLEFLTGTEVDRLVQKNKTKSDVVFCMPKDKETDTVASSLDDAVKVAWKHPGGIPVWGATVTEHPNAVEFLKFVGGPTGHRLWSESKAGFTMTHGKTHAEAFNWVVENRVKNTYPLTAMRILGELGGIRKGVCVDIGCGTGNLDVEIAKRSEFSIVGLDIDADMEALFYQRAKEAGFMDCMKFVAGDAQKMPFKDNFADVVISRGTLTFIPDIGRCLREVDRILKPTGVAFLGGRYLYTPYEDKKSNDEMKKIVSECGVPRAQFVDQRGQWVKIIGPEAPEAARVASGMGSHMLPMRILADYNIADGKCLLIFSKDGDSAASFQQGFLDLTAMELTAMYSSEEEQDKAEQRIKEAGLETRVTCSTGAIKELPFDEASFDLVISTGPILIFEKDRINAMKQVYRVLRHGGASLIGGKFVHMPKARQVPSEVLRQEAAKTGISSISILDDMGQWVEIRKGIKDRHLRD